MLNKKAVKKPSGKYENQLSAAFEACYMKQGAPDVAMMTPAFFMRLMMEMKDRGRMTGFSVGTKKGSQVQLSMPYTINGGPEAVTIVRVHVDSLCKEPIRMGQTISLKQVS